MSSEALRLEFPAPHTAVIFTRPRERNTLSVSTLERLENTLTALFPQTKLHTIIFTGTDDVFAAGADLCEVAALTPETARPFAERGQRIFQTIADAPQHTVAAVNGYCLGGALDLALSGALLRRRRCLRTGRSLVQQ